MNKKLILGAIIILAVAGGAYLVVNRPGSSGQATGNEPSEFVTHTSKDFSFEYPKGWFVEDYSEQSESNPFPAVYLNNYDVNVYTQSPHAQGNFFKLAIVKLPNEKGLSLENWVNEFMLSQESAPRLKSRSPFEVDGVHAIRQEELVQDILHPVIYLPQNSSVYVFNIGPDIPEFLDELDHVLRSFQFIQQ